jgi:hypothetical protein
MNKNKCCALLLFATICLSHGYRATSQTKVEFDNLVFFIPAGLNVNKTDNSMLISDASAGNGQYFTITVNRSGFSLKKMEKSFPVFWREALLNDGIDYPAAEPAFVKAQTNSGWQCFRGGKLVQYSAQTSSFYYHLTVMRYLGVTLRIVTRASSEDLFMQKIPVLMQLVSSINFKTPPPQTTNYPVSSNQNYPPPSTNTGNTNPGYNQPVQLNGLYIAVQGDLLTNAELSVLHFSPDGTVYTDIPEKGFFNLNMQQQKAQFPTLFGSFSTTNNTIAVRMNNQVPEATYTIDQYGSIKPAANPAQLFRKIESLDNYQLEGTFINKQSPAAGTIVFNRGSFTDNGLVKTVLSNGNQNFSNGNGSYSSRQNSLLLQYMDGRQLQLCFYMMPEDFQKGGRPDKILVGNYLLVKQ